MKKSLYIVENKQLLRNTLNVTLHDYFLHHFVLLSPKLNLVVFISALPQGFNRLNQAEVH